MYIYCNVEPLGSKVEDCVIRAITLTLGIPYDKVVNDLYDNGTCNQCDYLNVDCYSKLLCDYYKLPRVSITDSLTVEELAKAFPNNVIIARTKGHLTSIMFSNVYDIFDCRDYLVTDFWIVR